MRRTLMHCWEAITGLKKHVCGKRLPVKFDKYKTKYDYPTIALEPEEDKA